MAPKFSPRGINRALFNWIEQRGKSPNSVLARAWGTSGKDTIIESAKEFLDAGDSQIRLILADDMAEGVFRANTVALKQIGSELQREWRSVVRKLELQQTLPYNEQRDHTNHTAYLYLLGLWMYDHVPKIRDNVNQVFSGGASATYDFSLCWMFCSLLHDIGYVFYSLEQKQPLISARTEFQAYLDPEDITRFIEKRLQDIAKGLPSILDNAISNMRPQLREILATFTYPDLVSKNDTSKFLEDLAHISYGIDKNKNLGQRTDVWTMFENYRFPKGSLSIDSVKTHTQSEAQQGRVDHAVASGMYLAHCMCLLYTAIEKLREGNKLFDEFIKTTTYKKDTLTDLIIPSCFAVSAHNLKQFPLDLLETDPILFLQVLCDELQIWDRFYAGAQSTANLEDYRDRLIQAKDLSLKVTGERAVFILPEKACSRLKEKLTQKLGERWKSVVKLQES